MTMMSELLVASLLAVCMLNDVKQYQTRCNSSFGSIDFKRLEKSVIKKVVVVVSTSCVPISSPRTTPLHFSFPHPIYFYFDWVDDSVTWLGICNGAGWNGYGEL